MDISSLNAILLVAGWLVGGLVVVIGMRSQVAALTAEITLLRQALITINTRIDNHGAELAYLRGRSDERLGQLREKEV
jgi:uncharacterized membrane protein YphA (DoxX/SURF4 family)